MVEKPYPQNHPHYIQGVFAERERIFELMLRRLDHITDIAYSMGETGLPETWSVYPRSAWLELARFKEVIDGNLPVESDFDSTRFKGENE